MVVVVVAAYYRFMGMARLKKMTLRVVAEQLTEKEIGEEEEQ